MGRELDSHHSAWYGCHMRKTLTVVALVLGSLFLIGSPALAHGNPGVCSGTHITPADGIKSITVTAPDGQLISGYCVKAGSLNQGNGPVYITVNPPLPTVTITHPSGKDISHYTVTYVKAPDESTTTTVPEDTTTTTVGTSTTTPQGSDSSPPSISDPKTVTGTVQELPATGIDPAWVVVGVGLVGLGWLLVSLKRTG